jgi:outer membrane protein assembly factor BamB
MMDIRLLLRVLAVIALVIAVPLGLRALRRWPARRVSGIAAGGLAVLALGGFVLSALDVLAPRAPVPGLLSVYYEQGDTLVAVAAATGTARWQYTPPSPSVGPTFTTGMPPSDNGMLFIRTAGALRAVRATDGRELWAVPLEGNAFQRQQPTADHGVVYVTSAASVIALRGADGSQLWRTSEGATPGSATFPPQVANGSVYMAFSSGDGTVYALDTRDGAIRWTHTVAGADGASLTVADGIVYAVYVTQKATVVALNAGDGAVRWTHTLDDSVDAQMLGVTGGVLVLHSSESGLIALDAATGSLLWQRAALMGSRLPILDNGVVYLSGVIFDGGGEVVLAMDVRTGKERWRTLLGQNNDVFVSLAGQMLYVGGSYAYGLRTSDGHVVWRYGVRAQYWQPVASAGVVFIASSDLGSRFHLFGSSDSLNALDARTGHLYWRTPGGPADYPIMLYLP